MLKSIDELAVGDFVCDMHYGTRQLATRFTVVSQVQWGMTTPPSFPHLQNKELRVIGYDRSGAVVCAYNYDNVAQGIVVIDALPTKAEHDEVEQVAHVRTPFVADEGMAEFYAEYDNELLEVVEVCSKCRQKFTHLMKRGRLHEGGPDLCKNCS